MKRKITLVALFLQLVCMGLVAQLPRYYNKENTGAAFPAPPLPTLAQLPVVQPLPDPFVFHDGSGRSTNFNDWEKRRNEIRAEIEYYEIGTKFPRPDTISATFTRGATAGSGTLRVFVTRNGQTLTLTSAVAFPAGVTGPYPAVIGMNSASGSIPANIFTTRNIARITYSHNNVTTYLNPQPTDPFFKLYPEQTVSNSGQYSAWAWGVSRIIDGLELVQDSLPVDLKHIAVTGCSYAGKMALFAGAFDERVALTIAQESGGGGAPAWRVSETLGAVEKLGATDYNWFKDDMRQFSGVNVSKLPHDHHELMAMVAPRALLVTGNTDFEWLANPACYVSARAAKEVYKTFGISDRMGFYIDGGHNHCAVPNAQLPAISAFVDKFLLDKNEVNTDTVTINPYPTMDYKRWYQWWGTGNPVLPAEPVGVRLWMEAECAQVGSTWQVLTDSAASNNTYVVVNGLNSTVSAPAGAANQIVFNFTIDSAAQYNILGRLNCATADDDSYYIKVDNGAFASYNGLGTAGVWQWMRLLTSTFTPGPHSITVAYREDGAKMDKLLLTTSGGTITDLGPVAVNCTTGVPVISPGQVFTIDENQHKDSTIATVQATDPDANTKFQNWRITGGTGVAAFAIDIVSGKITVKDSSLVDFEKATSYTLTLTVTDGYHLSTPETVTIKLNNLNDNTPVLATQKLSIPENAAKNSLVGWVPSSDADNTNAPGFNTLQWQITGGTGAVVFAIDAATGKLTVKNNQFIDFEKKTSYTLNISVTDGTLTASVTDSVLITNVNDNNPVVTVNQRLFLDDYAWNGQELIRSPVKATDADDTNQTGFTTFQNWQIIGGNGAQAFAIDAATGKLTVKNADLLNSGSREFWDLSVRVSDGTRSGATDDIQIVVSTYVFVCQGGQSLYVQRRAAGNHIRRGATPGECAATAAVDNRGAQLMGVAGAEGLRVFPNPIRSQFTLVLGNNDLHIRKVELVDIAGRVLLQIPLNARTGTMNIEIPREKITRGIYMLRMQGDKVVTQKVMIE